MTSQCFQQQLWILNKDLLAVLGLTHQNTAKRRFRIKHFSTFPMHDWCHPVKTWHVILSWHPVKMIFEAIIRVGLIYSSVESIGHLLVEWCSENNFSVYFYLNINKQLIVNFRKRSVNQRQVPREVPQRQQTASCSQFAELKTSP